MQNFKNSSIVLSALLVIGLGAYFLLKNPIKEKVFNSIDNYSVTTPESSAKNIEITFPKQGSVLEEGQTYYITWYTPKGETIDKNISYSLVFNWGCMSDGSGCGYVSISDIDIHSKSFAWTVPNLDTYLSGGDSDRNISPEDKYKITIHASGSDNYFEKYSSSYFKIISK